MSNTFLRSLYYWFKAYIATGNVIDEFKDDTDKLLLSFWMNLTFSVLLDHTVGPAYASWCTGV